ncbi:SET domain-containing histone-lysine N-methyltransferase [Cystobacter fuscus]|uniref:SET domain-containing histone-lysine N-methyltransferase n=1 Tax=Cystobacter fuscus TaxID=43 RepID=UPI002B2EA7C5|nr:SET domain-containing protein-lysine N-methyltransferase [Cystobacter fuscus]
MSAYLEGELDNHVDENLQKERHALDWLQRAGASFPKLRIGHLEGGERGVFARADIEPGEELLRVPRQCLLTLERARASDIGRLIEAHAPHTDEESYLAAFLLQEREREDSTWKPYLELLPKDFSHLPLFFTEEELSLLKGSAMLREVARWRELLLGKYAQLIERVPGFSRYTPDAFLWAQFTLLSRTFGLTLEGQFVRGFVPLADMLNHRQSPEAAWGMSEDGAAFVLVALKDVPAGEEIHISYGVKPNYRFLLNYGFVPEHNADDELVLYLGIPEDDPWAAEKRELLALSNPTARRRFDVPLHYEHAATAAMFSFLRVAYAGTEELAHLTVAAKMEEGLGLVRPLSMATEERVLGALGELCEARLAGFETTLEEDERLLLEENLSRNKRNCLLLLRGEKRLLLAYAGLARTFLPPRSSAPPDDSAEAEGECP